MKESLKNEFTKTNNHNCNKNKNEANSKIVDDVVDVDGNQHCDDEDTGRQSKRNMDNNAQCRKKACLDRYDSSESSDSGVALLSGSSSNCDLSDPYSPSNSSSISSGFYNEDTECTKMSPTTDTEKSNLTSWLSFINFISNEQKPFDDNFSSTDPDLIQTSDITSIKNVKAEKSFKGHNENTAEEDGDDEDDPNDDDNDNDNETEDDKDNRETDNDHHDSNNNSARNIFKAKNKLKSSLPLATKLPPTRIVQKQRKLLPLLSEMEQKQQQQQQQQDSFKETDKNQTLLLQHKPRHKLNSQYEKFSGSDICLWKDCGKRFQSSSEFLDHLQADHITSQAGEEQFICKWTNCKVYNKPSCSKSWLERHVLSHAGKRPFKCIVDGCGAVFSTQTLLEKHVNSHFNNVQSCVSNQSVSNGSISSTSSNLSNSSSGGRSQAKTSATKTTSHSKMYSSSSSSSLSFYNNNSQIENNKTTNSCSSTTIATSSAAATYKSLNLPIACTQQSINQLSAVTATTSKCSKKNHKRNKSKRQSSVGLGGRSFDYFDDRIMDVVNRQLLVNYYPLKLNNVNNKNKTRCRIDAYANLNHETEVDCIVNESSDVSDSVDVVDDKHKHTHNDLIKLTSFVKGQMIDSNGTKTFLLKWIPENILPDEWVVEHQMESYRTISKQAYRSSLRNNSQLLVPTVSTNERLSPVLSSSSNCRSATSITTDRFATALSSLSETSSSSVLSSSSSSSLSSSPPPSFISTSSTPVSLSPTFSTSVSSTSSSWRRKYPKRHKIS